MKIIAGILGVVVMGASGLLQAGPEVTDLLNTRDRVPTDWPVPIPTNPGGDIIIVDHDEVPPPGDADVILTPGEKPAQFPKAASTSVSDYRCEHDSLDPAQSRARLLWAGENNIIPPSLVFKWLYSVQGNQVVMNARPYYPMFGTWNGRLNETQVWKPEAYGMPKRVPGGKVWVAVCRASCYTPEQQILTDKGYMPIEKAEQLQSASIVTLDEQSRMGALNFQSSPVLKYTASFQDTFHVILNFRTRSGGAIRVTPNHPLVNQDGRVVEASQLKVGDSLIASGGQPDLIDSIDVSTHFGKVYNIRPKDTAKKANIVMAQGFLSGSDRYQNEYFDLIQDQVLSSQIDESLIP